MKQILYTLKPHALKIFAALIVVVAIILIIVFTVKPSPQETIPEPAPQQATTSPTTPAPSSKPASGLVMVTKPFIIPGDAKATVTKDASGDSHGTFSVVFTVNPSDKDIVISPTCHNEEGSIKTDGVAFSIIRDGVHVTKPMLSGSSCVVLNHSGATKDDAGNYKVTANSFSTFELIVVNNPVDGGSYSVQVTNVGFRRSAKSISQFFELSPETLRGLKTNTVTL